MEHGLFGKGSELKNHKYYQRVKVRERYERLVELSGAQRNLKNAAKKGKAKVASLLREAANKIDS
jgi:hypothetical protein